MAIVGESGSGKSTTAMSILLLALANDVILLFLACELVSLASFMLIARSGKAGEAGSQRTMISLLVQMEAST